MASAALATALRQLHRLLREGTVAGLSDEQLLARFAESRDELAFEALIERHGRMVLSVCRAVLKEDHDAEDAFQATFLVLARKAGSIWVRESLGGWLHRVAYRIALQADGERRKRRTKEAAVSPPIERESDWSEWFPLLHEEIDRLPVALRDPIVLCDLQELTYEQAARQLRSTVPALRSRLARGRQRLRTRLTRRGMSQGVAVLGILASSRQVSAAVPVAWVRGAVESASCQQGASTAAGLLASAALRSMLAARLKGVATFAGVTVLFVATFGCLALGGGPNDDPPATSKANAGAPPAPPAAEKPGATVDIRGRVVDPRGRPVAGAVLRIDQLMFLDETWKEEEPTATSGEDGGFLLKAPRKVIDRFADLRARRAARIVALAPGYGPGWAEPGTRSDSLHEVTIRLVEDDVPIEGRVLDLEGRPVEGAIIQTSEFYDPPGGDLAPWIAAFRNGPHGPSEGLEAMPLRLRRTTGPDGRFRLDGIGRERVIMFTVSGPTIEVTRGFAMTRIAPAIRAANPHIIAPRTIAYHGARFDFITAASRPVSGVVRDQDTGAPLPGVTIHGMVNQERNHAYYYEVNSITDRDGRYQLPGLAPAESYRLFALPGKGQPYPTAMFTRSVGRAGTEPATIDLELKRGILLRGQVTDRGSGQPVEASVESYASSQNPIAKDYPTFTGSAPSVWTDADGRFEIAALPGRGFLAVRARSERYLRGVGAGAIPEMKGRDFAPALPSLLDISNYHALAAFSASPGSEPITCNLQCDAGTTRSGRIVDPEGKPVVGAWIQGLRPVEDPRHPPLDSDRFEAIGLHPEHRRRIYIFHDERALAGSVVAQGEERQPWIIHLQPQGLITGRILDGDGQPMTQLELINFNEPGFDPGKGQLVRGCLVGADGRFRLAVVPGLTYEATALGRSGARRNRIVGQVFKGVRVAPGETTDLGDVTVKKTQGE